MRSGAHSVDHAHLSSGCGRRPRRRWAGGDRRTALRRARSCYDFQSGNLLPALSAGDQLRLAGRLVGDRRVDPTALLEAVGMEHRRTMEMVDGRLEAAELIAS